VLRLDNGSSTRTEDAAGFAPGQEIRADVFAAGDLAEPTAQVRIAVVAVGEVHLRVARVDAVGRGGGVAGEGGEDGGKQEAGHRWAPCRGG
jgi:hypothetical protein